MNETMQLTTSAAKVETRRTPPGLGILRRAFRGTILAALLAATALGVSGKPVFALTEYTFAIPGGTAATWGLNCDTWKDVSGTKTRITVHQPHDAQYSAYPTSRVRLTTQLDYSTNNVNWYRFKLYAPQYRTVGTTSGGLRSFDFGSFYQPVSIDGSDTRSYHRVWFKVDFVNSSNVVVQGGAWKLVPATSSTSNWQDFTNPWDYGLGANNVCLLTRYMPY